MRSYVSGMGVGFRVVSISSVILFAAVVFGVRAQGLGALDEDKSFYTNYATTNYSKEILEERLDEFYDLFGNYITNGYFTYSLSTNREFVTNQSVTDSTVISLNNEHRDELFFQSFSNICVSRDAIGGVKSAFLIGDQIRTQFAPLTFNKRNYEGIRWDLFYEGLGVTALISRTRPGLMARSYESGMGFQADEKIRDSWMTYPIFGSDLTENNAGEQWNSSTTSYVDFTARSFYGDYDFLWAFYAHKRLMDKVDVGLSYVNHHHSDVAKGEKWNGDLPDALAPDEIHFEFYDRTPLDVNDAGVKIHAVSMTVTTTGGSYTQPIPESFFQDRYGQIVQSTGIVNHFLVEQKATAGMLPYSVNGSFPAICSFYPKEYIAQNTSGDSSKITDISFDITVSGNYIVFVATDKIAVMNAEHWSNEEQKVLQKQLRDISVPRDSLIQNPGVYEDSVIDFYNTKNKSELYLGDYIAKSHGITRNEDGNYTTFTYRYRIPVARITYGIDVKGELFNVDFDGEIAANVKRAKYPASDADVVQQLNMAAYLNCRYPLSATTKLTGSVFNMAPDYQPALTYYPFSPALGIALRQASSGAEPQQNDYPFVLSNQYSVIDDNDDDDYYADTDRRRYPSELNKNSGGGFYAEGTRQSPQWLTLPSYGDSTFTIVYDDVNGIISDRYDRNRNGVLDYEEDFLLFNADPPRYDLEPDDNGNGVPDSQEDDIYPDYPVKPVYMYTSNGFKSLGVRGIALQAHMQRSKNLELSFGGSYRSAIEQVQLDGNVDDLSLDHEAAADEGRAWQCGGRLVYRFSKRDAGVSVFAGQEVKFIQDGIRDDVVMSETDSDNNVTYHIQTDPLQYRNAFLSRSAVALNYLNIPKLEVTVKLGFDFEKHIALSDRINRAFTFYNEVHEQYEYINSVGDYGKASVGDASGVVKLGYTFEFDKERLPGYLAALSGLKVVPQYKIMYERAVTTLDDPRDNEYYLILEQIYNEENEAQKTAFEADGRQAFADWFLFDNASNNRILTVPILRALYPVGDKSTLEFGWQFKRNLDLLVPERSYSRQSRVLQLVMTDNYMSFNISLQMGWAWEHTDYMVNRYSHLYHYGNNWDASHSKVFCKIYAGI